MRIPTTLALVLTILTPAFPGTSASAHAQELFHRGRAIRVSTQTTPDQWIRGQIFDLNPTRLRVQEASGGTVALPWDSLRTVQLGIPGSPASGAVRGALGGALVLGVGLAAFSSGRSIAGPVLGGAVIGAALGALSAQRTYEGWFEVPRERWPYPEGRGAVGLVGIRLSVRWAGF